MALGDVAAHPPGAATGLAVGAMIAAAYQRGLSMFALRYCLRPIIEWVTANVALIYATHADREVSGTAEGARQLGGWRYDLLGDCLVLHERIVMSQREHVPRRRAAPVGATGGVAAPVHPTTDAQPTTHMPTLHWPEYGAELLGTAFLVFAGLSAVVLDFGQGSPIAAPIPNAGWRLLLTGLLFAGAGSLVAISPVGKLSGAHINPAVSLAFWLHGKLRTLDLVGYIAGQVVGAILGAALLAVAWGARATSVRDGMTLPGPTYPLWVPFVAEVALTGVLVLGVFLFVSDTRLMRWTPLMTWLLVATMVWQEAPISGTSLNPARSLGPALIASYWAQQWLYIVAPPLGAALAVGAYRLIGVFRADGLDVLTGKLFHTPHYRSVFRRVSAPAMPHNGKLRSTEPAERAQQTRRMRQFKRRRGRRGK